MSCYYGISSFVLLDIPFATILVKIVQKYLQFFKSRGE